MSKPNSQEPLYTKCVSAVILAGGEGRRMGNIDKCQLEVGGRTILDRVVTTLTPLVREVFLNVNGDTQRFEAINLPLISDQHLPPIGPLGGVLSTLNALQTSTRPPDWLLSVPGDCPFIPSDLLSRLFRAADPDCRVVYARSGGRDHFVVALWSLKVMPELSDFIAQGQRSVGRFIAAQPHRVVDFEITGIDPFLNINSPSQWQEAKNYSLQLAEEKSYDK